MGCTASKESSSPGKKRAILYGSDTHIPTQRYLLDPNPPSKQAASGRSNVFGSGEAARSKETFDSYAQRGVIRGSVLLPESVKSKRTEQLANKKRVGGYEKYTRE